MEALSVLTSLIADIPTVSAQSAHIALLRDQLELVKERVMQLEEENTRLAQEVAELQQQLASQVPTPEYTECRGALFKRKPGGGYSAHPVCPACHAAMNSFQNLIVYKCGNQGCRREANFTGSELPDVLQELSASDQLL